MNGIYVILINNKNKEYFLNYKYNDNAKFFFIGPLEYKNLLENKLKKNNYEFFIKEEVNIIDIINKIDSEEVTFLNNYSQDEILEDNKYIISFKHHKKTIMENKLEFLLTINADNINYIKVKTALIKKLNFSNLYELSIELMKNYDGKIEATIDANYPSFINIDTQGEMINIIETKLLNFINFNNDNYEELINLLNEFNINRNYGLSACIFKLLFEKYPSKQNELCNKYKIDINQIKKMSKNKKNILFYSNDWYHGGIERVLSIILPELTNDYNTILCYPSNHEKNGFSLENSIITIKNYYDYNVMFSLLAITLITNTDIFIGNPCVLVDYTYIFEYLKCFKIKSIAINHYYYFLPYMQNHLNIMIRERHNIFKHADIVAWLTEFNLCAYSHLYTNGILLNNPTNYKITKKSKENGKTIVSVGRFQDPIKRIDKILKVFNEARKIDCDLKLLIVGNYELGYQLPEFNNITIEDFKETKSNDNIEWYGETDQISEIYKSSDLILMTSECEGLPLALIEGITHGLPIAMFKINGMEGIVENNINGIVTEQDCFEKLGKEIANLLNNKEKYKKFSNNSIEKALKYQKDSVVNEYRNLIESLLNNNQIIKYKEELNKFNHDVIEEYEKNINYLLSNIDLTPAIIIPESKFKRGLKYLKKNGIKKTIIKIKRILIK